jgi:lipoprotein-releasing system ATP-binding protein
VVILEINLSFDSSRKKYMNKNALSLHNVYKSYAQAAAVIGVLKGVNATFEQGASYAITGISGSGKSTLIHLLAGLDEPTSGQVSYNGASLATLRDYKKSLFLNKSIGLVFQYPYLIKELTVLENVMLKGLIAGRPTKACQDDAHVLLEQVGLAEKASVYPGQLSGGQQQRVALARALMNKPDFLLADEPTGNLDVQTGTTIINLILDAQKTWGMGIIICSHDAYVAQKMNVILELRNGTLLRR